MKRDEDKTKAELIKELENIRRQLAGLEITETERTVAERELQEIRDAVFHATPDLVAVIDKKWIIRDINEAMAKRLGKSREELIGNSGWNLLPRKLAESRNRYFQNIFRTGEPCRFEDENNGTYFDNIVYPVLWERGKVKMIAIHATDSTERKKAEEALIENEALLNEVCGIAKIGGWEMDLITRKAVWTKGLYDIVEIDYGDPIPGPDEHIEYYLPEYRSLVEDAMNRLIEEDRPMDYEAQFQTAKGNIRWARIKGKGIRINNKCIKVFGTTQDITGRREAEEKYQTILNTTLEGFAIIGLNTKILEVNDSYCQMVGYTREELLKMSVPEIDILQDPDCVAERIKKMITQGPDFFETKHKRKDGQVIDVEVSSHYLDIDQGQFFIFLRDITERKQAEERINQLNLMLRSIRNINQLITREKDLDRLLQGVCNNLIENHNCSDACVALIDESGNLSAHAEAGLKGEYLPILAHLRKGEMPACFRQALSQPEVVVIEFPGSTCSECESVDSCCGEGVLTARMEYEGHVYGVLCASVSRSTLLDEEEVGLFQEVSADIAFALRDMELETEHKLLEEEHLRIAKLESVGTLAGGIAHDFNNLLTGIMGNIGLAKRNLKPEDKTFERLEEAEKAVVRARGLTQQLLTFARGGMPVKKLSSLTEVVKESAVFALRGSNVSLELSLPADLWAAEFDEGQMSQVIHNIVINADEAMPSGGMLNISARNVTIKRLRAVPLPGGNYVRIDIKDEGIGISKKQLERIFEPYYTTKQKGSGLGLATAYSIIKNHGGYITAESKQNVGATFHIYLPASDKSITAREEVEEETGITGKSKILVMDDEETIREMLGKMLPLVGCEVELTSNGTEAIDRYAEAVKVGKPFDIVIMDLTIPGGMGGKEAIKKLLEIDPEAKVLVSSGYATDPIMSEYKKYGFSGVVTKPYSVAEIEKTLHSLLKKYKNK